MKITVLGAGNSGLAMAAHLTKGGHQVSLWNRSRDTIERIIQTGEIHCEGVIEGTYSIALVTDNLAQAVEEPDIIFITTPANGHRELAQLIGETIRKSTMIILNPGRTFGALEFKEVYEQQNPKYPQIIAETQTIVYTCRKTRPDAVQILALKQDVLLSTFNPKYNRGIISRLPECLQPFFKPAKSMVETSIGNVGMILHCTPLLLNAGWTENINSSYKYYYDGITPSIGRLLEKIDAERIEVSRLLGDEVESTRAWLERSYGVSGDSLFDAIQKNEAYKSIEAPSQLDHRYILEDIPYGLVPLESVGKELGLEMKNTGLIIDLASSIMELNFRATGRSIHNYKLLQSSEGSDFYDRALCFD